MGKQFSSSLSESNNLAVEVAARLAASIEKDTQGNDAGEGIDVVAGDAPLRGCWTYLGGPTCRSSC